ncbi:PDZ domain-containing protein [Marinicella rhabdoformis]|uniref:PDZ domain-containing protein n=1 Tax=Marinicella rhabdoformis TaxID=2580566 RepID=UPI0012AEBEA3|nr:PDZ domain-containing protein [Marinicella rhabdoformis]
MNNTYLKTAITAALMAASLSSLAEETQTVDVDVKVEGNQGKVLIIKDNDGKVTKIHENLDLADGEDMQDKLDALMAEHGIDINAEGAEVHKEVIVLSDEDIVLSDEDIVHGNHKMMFVQKSNDINVDIEDGVAKVFIKKDVDGEVQVIEETMEVGEDEDLNQLIEDLMIEHGIEADEGQVHKKIIKLDRRAVSIDENKPRLGFMASVSDAGWDVISVVPESGAAEAGIQAGDVIVSVDGAETGKEGMGLNDFSKNNYQAGDLIEVIVDRNGNEMVVDVEAKVVNSPDVLMKNVHQWISKDGEVEIENIHGPSAFTFKFDGKDGQALGEHLNLGDHEVRVMTTGGEADAYFFSNGKMNQWLGKKHHFSTVTKDLGKYFGVDSGVLVLEVDADNKLGLEDGDVIQSINGEVVNSPKDVVKKMSALKNDDQVEIEIYRNKEKLYLES